jgi:hypothetical protein
MLDVAGDCLPLNALPNAQVNARMPRERRDKNQSNPLATYVGLNRLLGLEVAHIAGPTNATHIVHKGLLMPQDVPERHEEASV